jgi:hypothetical protein
MLVAELQVMEATNEQLHVSASTKKIIIELDEWKRICINIEK